MDNNNNKGNILAEPTVANPSKTLSINEKEQSIESKNSAKGMEAIENKSPNKQSFPNIFLLVCIVGVSLGILLEIINVGKRNHRFKPENCMERPKYWTYSKSFDVNRHDGVLKHVHGVLGRVGYEKVTDNSSWDLLWSHSFPFNDLQNTLLNLKSHQRVNHYPGSGFISNKVDLATTESKYIPKAFQLPKRKDDFLKYVSANKYSLFLEKNNQHRGVRLKNVSEIDVSSGESFVQEYIQKPFLVDGHKFDIGVYVVITSVDPLRAYWYKGDVLFRYCPSKYYPLDPKDLDKYVISDHYLPTWEVPSLAMPFTALGYSMKDAFDLYVRSKGKDPSVMWENVQKAIADLLLIKEHHIVRATKRYPSKDNFFEMMRFDLIVDDDLKVYLLEANMSPNLDSAHFRKNALLYEQVLYNLFSLTGIARENNYVKSSKNSTPQDMITSQKHISVFGDQCVAVCNEDCGASPLCKLCRPCLDAELKNSLLKAHTEFLHRGDFRRLVPMSMSQVEDIEEIIHAQPKELKGSNLVQHLWYQGKCNQDMTWCT